MAFSREELEKIISRVLEEALKKHMQSTSAESKTLALLSGYIFCPESITSYLKTMEADVALFGAARLRECGLKMMRVETDEDRDSLASVLRKYEEVVLVTPSLNLIKAIANGDDSTFQNMLILRSLLWGKKISLLLDFEIPGGKSDTIFAGVAESLEVISKMGICVKTLSENTKENVGRKDLVTEQDVKEAYVTPDKCIRVGKGAIVTQLARDTAQELGVSIRG